MVSAGGVVVVKDGVVVIVMVVVIGIEMVVRVLKKKF